MTPRRAWPHAGRVPTLRERFDRWLCRRGLHDWRTRRVFYAPAVTYGSVAATPRVIGEECRRRVPLGTMGAERRPLFKVCGARRIAGGFPAPLPDDPVWRDARAWTGRILATPPDWSTFVRLFPGRDGKPDRWRDDGLIRAAAATQKGAGAQHWSFTEDDGGVWVNAWRSRPEVEGRLPLLLGWGKCRRATSPPFPGPRG